MAYSLITAAVATGAHRTTILRAIKSGKISAERDAQGAWVIQPSELHRVFAPLPQLPAVAEPVQLAYLWRPAVPDDDDDMVLEAAVNGRADGIVTFNLSDFVRSAKQFGVEVMRPGEAVKRLEQNP